MIVQRSGVGGKVCSHCKVWKPLADFPRDPSHGSSQAGRHCICRSCRREKGKAARERARRTRSLLEKHPD
jgi:hypothetical protein